MNRSLSLHPLSLVLGAVFAGICFVSMSQVWPAGHHVLVSYGPNPRDYVQIQGVAPYTVPPGKVFVLTALGATASLTNMCPVTLSVNNGADSMSLNAITTADTGPMKGVPSGFTVPAGASITLSAVGCNVDSMLRAWGYLAPQ